MDTPRRSSLYQINTRVWLTSLARSLGRPATLDDIPDAELDRLAGMNFDWICDDRDARDQAPGALSSAGAALSITPLATGMDPRTSGP